MSFMNVSPTSRYRPQYSKYVVDVEWSQRFRKQVPVAAPPPYTPTIGGYPTGGGAGGFAILRDPVAPPGADPK